MTALRDQLRAALGNHLHAQPRTPLAQLLAERLAQPFTPETGPRTELATMLHATLDAPARDNPAAGSIARRRP